MNANTVDADLEIQDLTCDDSRVFTGPSLEPSLDIQKIAEKAGYETSSYSGRSMYGERCLGVCINSGGMGRLLASLVIEASTPATSKSLADALKGMRVDSLGRGEVVYFMWLCPSSSSGVEVSLQPRSAPQN